MSKSRYINCTIVNHDKIMKGYDIAVENGIIKSIEKSKQSSSGFDCSDFLVFPGLVDLHSHLREPGEEYKEDIFSGCSAAVKGGYTAIAVMPNTAPPIDNPQSISYIKKREAEFGKISILPLGALTKGLESAEITEMYEMVRSGAAGFSDDGKGTTNSKVFLNALRYASKLNAFISVHCEERTLSEGGFINESAISVETGLNGIPSIEEEIAVFRNLTIASYLKSRLHIAHISTKRSLSIIRDFKKQNEGITCEVTPHHLIFNENVHKTFNTNYKVKPPLRSESDRKALVKGIIDGSIDVIATDHAPHQLFEKEVEFIYAPFGMIGFETALQSIYTYLVKPNLIDIKSVAALMAYNPARIIGADERYIKEGAKANLTIFDPNAEETVEAENIVSRSCNTPLIGSKLRGSVVKTVFNGREVYSRND